MSYTDKFGVRFSDDRKTLEHCPKDFQGRYVIPDGVTKIGVDYCSQIIDFPLIDDNNDAFRDCSKLTEVIIPNSVSEIVVDSFSKCISLKKIILPNGLKEVYDNTFYGCTSLETISFPGSLEKIGENAFSCCSALTKIHLFNKIKSIGYLAFSDCISLKEIKIDNPTVELEADSFEGCWNVKKVYLTEAFNSLMFPTAKRIQIKSIYYTISIAQHNIKYEEIVFPDIVSTLYLREIYLPEDCFSSCGKGFKENTYINYLTGNSFLWRFYAFTPLNQLPFGVFIKRQSLNKISVSPRHPLFDSRGNCNAVIYSQHNTLVIGCNNTIIPNDITSIADYAFEDCRKIRTIHIPDSVTKIGSHAFRRCHNLSEIRLSANITEIGENAFPHGKSFKKIIVPKGMKTHFINIGLKKYQDLIVEE